jgi:hypothetical protein
VSKPCQLRVRRISRSKYPAVYQVVADHCGQPILFGGQVFEPAKTFNPAHDELIVPNGVSCPALATRQRLWPAVEAAETRTDANLATYWQGRIPDDLSGSAANGLAMEFGQYLADYLASVVHLVVLPASLGEAARMRALCTAREAGPDGFGLKNRFNLSVAQRRKRGFPISPRAEFSDLREAWVQICSAHLEHRNASFSEAS